MEVKVEYLGMKVKRKDRIKSLLSLDNLYTGDGGPEVLKGYPAILELPLKDGSKYELPIYVDQKMGKPEIKIPYITSKDAEVLKNIDTNESPKIIINEYDENYLRDIRLVDSLNGETFHMVEDGNIFKRSRRFLLAIQHAADRGSKIRIVTGPRDLPDLLFTHSRS